MKKATFKRGVKGSNLDGTKTAFRNYRKFRRSLDVSGSYAQDLVRWTIDGEPNLGAQYV